MTDIELTEDENKPRIEKIYLADNQEFTIELDKGDGEETYERCWKTGTIHLEPKYDSWNVGYEAKQQILDGQKALEELRYIKELNNGLDFQCETLQTENQKLNEKANEYDRIKIDYLERYDTIEKLKAEIEELLTNYSEDKLEINDLRKEIEEFKKLESKN